MAPSLRAGPGEVANELDESTVSWEGHLLCFAEWHPGELKPLYNRHFGARSSVLQREFSGIFTRTIYWLMMYCNNNRDSMLCVLSLSNQNPKQSSSR